MPKGRIKPKSQYGIQLEEKQELRGTYALRETQFRRYFKAGSTPEEIVQTLELRLDNVVYRAGFAITIRAARQLVSHGHIQLNEKNVNIQSLQVALNDVVRISHRSRGKNIFKDLVTTLKKYEPPTWLSLDKSELTVKVTGRPTTTDPIIIGRIRPVIEFYSR